MHHLKPHSKIQGVVAKHVLKKLATMEMIALRLIDMNTWIINF